MIETERLVLRQFQESDAEDVFEYLHQPAVHCFYNMKLDSLEDAKAEMKKRAQNDLYLAIVLKGSNKVIGELFSFAEGTDPESEVMDNYSPCWMLNLAYSGKGYAHEAAHAYFDYLFNERGARRIYAYTEDTNLPSQHLCERFGMRREGLFMEFVSFIKNSDGTPLYENTVQYAILKKEWERLAKPTFKNADENGLMET